MSSRRAPSSPPLLDGFDAIEIIGSGGYADVFLYQQRLPDRPVAVKVLVGDVVAGASFTAEANLMARVSAHPYIVTIFEARVSDDGRPYLVMEYYPGLNHLERARSERFSIADALRVGIQVGGAVETAHRAGIMHRDIKPANILTSDYGRPGLTDFGIAAAEGPGEEADGVSIPWSPPEAFGNCTLDARADVYSLAATVYHLLAGRSPFEVPGSKNSSLDLMSRIERERLAPIGRSDMPTSLVRLLAQSMSKDPTHRPATVAEFARSMQAVESELRLGTTSLELPDVGRTVRIRGDDSDDDATRVRGVTEIAAQPLAPIIADVPRDGFEEDRTVRPERVRQGLLSEPDIANTVHRVVVDDVMGASAEMAGDQRNRLILSAAVAFVLVLALVGFFVFGGDDDRSSASTSTVFSIGGPDEAIFVSAVENLSGSVGEGIVRFTWDAPSADADDEYIFERTVDGVEVITGRSDTREVSFDGIEPATEVCIDVVVRRSGAADSASKKACVDA